ncbi:metallophosphoesterase family protein [Noviherbaspirillum saxi]|nr:metallophosphoesterase family protein [Noviherbaspirillum saxi]
MRVAILGDIHGNAAALHAVLDAARNDGVEKLLVTGDLVGYYFSPCTVLELLEPWDKCIVRGNHEAMLAEARVSSLRLADIEARYGSGIRVALDELSDAQLDGLCELPHPMHVMIDACAILLCHGAPWNLDEYIYPDAPQGIVERCIGEARDIVITGHTHYPMLRQIGKRVLVNPGSVGQPRDRQPGAAWALLDSVSGEISLRREYYDMQPLIEEARRRHPELPYLAEVLCRT